ncbi:hypothetical protein NC652_003634 [Populus alba x Populus x berolinensis]|nr:hypothetical protein NC652_003634 [Populus alba x Populus x berolinensis]
MLSSIDKCEGILYTHSITSEDVSQYFNDKIPLDIVLVLKSCIITDKIKESLFFIPDDKDPNPNGYTRSSKEIIGRDFIVIVRLKGYWSS